MALLVKNAKFVNTQITAPEVYVRLQYFADANGKSASVALLTGLDKAGALAYESIPVNLPEQVLVAIPEGDNQDLATIHNLVKANLEALELGLEVTVQL
jgi:hypothetical protein